MVRQTPWAHPLQGQMETRWVPLASISWDLERAINTRSCFPRKRHTLLIYEKVSARHPGPSAPAAEPGSAWRAPPPPARHTGC